MSNNLKLLINQLSKILADNDVKLSFSTIEKQLANKIDETSKIEEFFQLPFENILSIIEKSDLWQYDESISIVRNIIQNISKKFPEKSGLLLNAIKCENSSYLTLNDSICLLGELKTCDLCVQLKSLDNEAEKTLDFDYQYEFEQKEKEIKNLKDQIANYEVIVTQQNINTEGTVANQSTSNTTTPIFFPPVTQKPDKYIKDPYTAAKKGDLASLQYAIEQLGYDVDLNDPALFSFKNTFLHLAAGKGHMNIVRYL